MAGHDGHSTLAYKAAKPLFYFFGKVTPHIALHGGNLTAFGDSIHASRYGEWDYDLEKKPLGGHKKYIGWARAVFKGFDIIHSGRVDVGVPILTLTSTKSMFSAPYSEELNYADAVIDVKQSQNGPKSLALITPFARLKELVMMFSYLASRSGTKHFE